MITIKSSIAALLGVLAGAGAITGTFSGLAGGAEVPVGAAGVNISHVDGAGSVVTLTVTNPMLTVTKAGSGSGTVTSNVGAINCDPTCSDSYPTPTPITLTAAPAPGSQFTGWLGPCTGVGTCQFTFNAATTAVATFAPMLLGAPRLDIDGTTNCDALTDGLLVLRYLFGLAGASLINGAVAPGAARTSDTQIGGYLTDIKPVLDIDGNGQADALTDGLLIIRYLFGLRDASLIAGAVGPGAIRTTALDIEAQIQSLCLPATAIYTLTVSLTGSGSGTVTSAPAGITCGADCTESYNAGTVVTLTATPGTGSTFSGWGGACAGPCVLTMDAAKSVSANFTLNTYVLTVSVLGAGTVTSVPAGINCGVGGADCTKIYNYNTVVFLMPKPSSILWFFDGWGGGVCPVMGTCLVTMDADKVVTARFIIPQ